MPPSFSPYPIAIPVLALIIIFVFFGFTDWLNDMTVKKLVVIIKSIDTNEVLERWQFDIECDKSFLDNP